MKKPIVFASSFMAFAIMLAMSTAASAAPPDTAPGQNKLMCFDGPSEMTVFGGLCTLTGNGAKGPATLDNTDTNPNGDFSGVFVDHTTMSGQLLGDVTQLGYHYTGTTAPSPGDLSLNVPLDENNDGMLDEFAFVDAFYCPGVGGTVDIINDPNCGIFVGGVTFFPNWAALVAAHPTWKVDLDTDQVPFLIAERVPSEGPAFWTVSNVKFGKGGK